MSGPVASIPGWAVSGGHSYCFDPSPRLCWVGEDLLRLLGCDADALLGQQDGYRNMVCPGDRGRYDAFLSRCGMNEGRHQVEYRLQNVDSQLFYVTDTMITRRNAQGVMEGFSTLGDLTRLQARSEDLAIANTAAPYGFLKYTCDKRPKITYISEQMRRLIRIPESDEVDYLKMYMDNFYLLVAPEKRSKFSRFLDQVMAERSPVVGEATLIRADGTRCRVLGWVTLSQNAQGEPEFQSMCMDITSHYHAKKHDEMTQYLKALNDVYDRIFEYNRERRTVTCLYGQNSNMFRWFENVPMQMEEATENWIFNTVSPECQEDVRSFFRSYFDGTLKTEQGRPPQIRYRALSSSGNTRSYCGIFLTVDSGVSLFCCRHLSEEDELSKLKHETEALKDMNSNMQELILQFTDGIAAFEIREGLVKPLYSSDNVREFFGFDQGEWRYLTKNPTPMAEFASRSDVPYDQFQELFRKGEAEFTYYDVHQGKERKIRAICSRKNANPQAAQYVMLYKMGQEPGVPAALPGVQQSVKIRTFGYFDVFVEGKPIAFRSQKAKELFALLVDRRGGYITSEEAITFLWEDEPVSTVTQARYRKVALRLKNILEEYSIPDVVEAVDGKRRIVPELVSCDLYDYLADQQKNAQLFKGSYLTNYSWGETTLGELTSRNLY